MGQITAPFFKTHTYYSFSDIASGVTIVEPLLFEQAETNSVAATARITKILFMVGLLEGFLT